MASRRVVDQEPTSASQASSDLFNIPQWSDLTVRCGTKTWSCHQIILCPRSGYFRAACAWKEEIQNDPKRSHTTVEVLDDEIDAVEMWLRFLYDLVHPAIDLNNARTAVHAHTIADKYSSDGLMFATVLGLERCLTVRQIKAGLRCTSYPNDDTVVDLLFDVADALWQAKEFTELNEARELAMRALVYLKDKIHESAALDTLIHNRPEFGVDFANFLLRRRRV